MSVAEAARRLRLDRSRVYTLVRSGELQGTTDPVDGLRVDGASVEHRRALVGELAGSPLSAANAWLAIALASADPLFEAHVSGLVRPAMLPRVRARLDQEGLLALAPGLCSPKAAKANGYLRRSRRDRQRSSFDSDRSLAPYRS